MRNYLHSTMYLFKLRFLGNKCVQLWYLHSTMYLFKRNFRFCSLSIFCHLHSTMYLFKLNNSQTTFLMNKIYIPPCIYLNRAQWWWKRIYKSNLHSTMYLFKHLTQKQQFFCHLYLHSTMYLFKPNFFSYFSGLC